MVIAMSQPWKHPDTGVLYFRGRVSAELIETLKNQKLTVRVGDTYRTFTVAAMGVNVTRRNTHPASPSRL
ncbi:MULTISPECIES: hypothetical protein [unclassified Chelatococcus]|uniref:hypothetical protein n=1 Tax=unclassified Chelatococcus TaxID=2638111 RepID=UPI001BCACFF6|nr:MULTISPECIES: hypothetical protein [unclassified Chelatococcus]CAH1656712.1 hypothetical protein CHELA41_21287 [Hyphomicrobiales bacterium]MBS7740576.1 hypothetical protein [Chelatococcus sp. HY11]MBX3544640.1 hypothetical protein [Chelatococcus sp.]MCO5078181.1 hypothetical protein [Chelatococcus sp.]CAH1684654.1 hypothetical protein CHELA20_53640 [Hyphomicrobiales bacterium]